MSWLPLYAGPGISLRDHTCEALPLRHNQVVAAAMAAAVAAAAVVAVVAVAAVAMAVGVAVARANGKEVDVAVALGEEVVEEAGTALNSRGVWYSRSFAMLDFQLGYLPDPPR